MIDFKRKMQVTLDAAAALIRGGQAAVPAVRDVPDGVSKNADGSVTVTQSFRLDPKFVAANRQASKKRLQLAQAGQQRVLQPKFAGGLVGQPFISARDEAIPVEDMDTAVGDMIISVGYHLFLVGGDVNRRIQGNDVNGINRSEVERVLTEAAFVRGISYGLAVSKDGFQDYVDDEIREGERTLRYSYRHGFATPVHVTADPREYLKEHGVSDDLHTPGVGVAMDADGSSCKVGDRIRVKVGLRCRESGKPGTVVAVWEKPDDPFKGRVLVKIRMDSDGHEFSGFADSYVGERLPPEAWKSDPFVKEVKDHFGCKDDYFPGDTYEQMQRRLEGETTMDVAMKGAEGDTMAREIQIDAILLLVKVGTPEAVELAHKFGKCLMGRAKGEEVVKHMAEAALVFRDAREDENPAKKRFACDSKGHDTPLENCKAQNPMFCPYHGIAAMSQNFIQYLNKYGLVGAYDHVPFEIFKKPSGAFAVSVNCGEMSQKAAENAIAEFLKQPGFIVAGGQTTSTGAVQGQVKQEGTFKQDYVYRPDDLSMLDEWMDSLYQSAADEDTVDLDALTELESKVAGLKAMKNVSNPSAEQQQKYAELLKDAQAHYHGMKAKIDFKDLTDVDAASFKGKELFDAFEKCYGEAKKVQNELQVTKQSAWGSTKNPIGFPGNDEVGYASSAVLKTDGDLMSDAKAALADAVDKGDLDAAKVALHNMEYATEKIAKDLDKYKVHAQAMTDNIMKAIEKGIEGSSAAGKGKEGKMAWFEKMGIAYPEELKAVKKAVEAVTPGTEAFKQAQAAAKAAQQSQQQPTATPAAATPAGSAQNALFGGASASPAGGQQQKTPSQKPKAAAATGLTDVPPGSPDYDPFATSTLPPLEHDESKFPANVTQSVLDAAIASGKGAGGGGGLGTKIVTIGGKKYICKNGTGKEKAAIENGFACDMAYRAGGVHAPDAKLYTFGGKVYKLAEFIEGERLDSIMSGSDEAKKNQVRRELLKGYPLDALFSNWDVLGTNPSSGLHFSNVILDKDGHAYRIDNDGAFAMTGLVGGKKNPSQGNCDITGVDLEQWSSWNDRQFCDDWITMRADPQNVGVFDRYSTHDIFSAAMAIDFDAACASLPKGIQDALAKPKKEMVQMTDRCRDNCNGRIGNNGSSMMLDGSYALSKDGAREAIAGEKSQYSHGYGKAKTDGSAHSGYNKQPFKEPEPQKPAEPQVSHNYAQDILNAVKTINYHNGGIDGFSTDVTDHQPNKDKMAKYEAAKPIIEKLAKAGNKDAKVLVGFINDVEASKKAGFTKGIGMCPTTFVISDSEGDSKAIADYQKAIAAWKPKHDVWEAKKTQHDQAEAQKEADYAKAHGKPKFCSLTDQVSKQCAKSGCSHAWIESSNKSQGGSSWSSGAVRTKVCEAILRGMDPKVPKLPGMWIAGNQGAFNAICAEYAANPKKMQKDVQALAIHKAAIQLMMENSTISGCPTAINHERHTVFAVRSEGWLGNSNGAKTGAEYMKKYGHKANTVVSKLETGTCESHAVCDTTGHGAWYGVRIPFSSICGSYWMEAHPGQADDAFLGDGEAEFTLDRTNLPHVPVVCFGTSGSSYSGFMQKYDDIVSAHYAKKAKAVKKA